MLPQKAIICVPDVSEAKKLNDFLAEVGDKRFIKIDDTDFDEDMCFDLEANTSNNILYNNTRSGYEDDCESHDNGNSISFIPDEKEWRFVDVNHFIAKCIGLDVPNEEIKISCEDLF